MNIINTDGFMLFFMQICAMFHSMPRSTFLNVTYDDPYLISYRKNVDDAPIYKEIEKKVIKSGKNEDNKSENNQFETITSKSGITHKTIGILLTRNQRHKIIHGNCLNKCFKNLSQYEKIATLPEFFKMLNFNFEFISDQNCYILYKCDKILLKQTLDFKSENTEKISLIIPHHALVFIKSLQRSKNLTKKNCLETLVMLLEYDEILEVHIHSDQTLNTFNSINSSLSFLKEINSAKIVTTIELNFSYQNKPTRQHTLLRSLPKRSTSFSISDKFINVDFVDLTSFCNLKHLEIAFLTDILIQRLVLAKKSYTHLTTLVFKYTNLDENIINFIKKFTNLENLIFKECYKIEWKSVEEINRLKIKKTLFEKVKCKKFKFNEIKFEDVSFSMENEKISMLKTQHLNITKNQIFSFYGSENLVSEITTLKLGDIMYFEGIFVKCLSLSNITQLEMHICVPRSLNNIILPRECACHDTLTSLKLSVFIDNNVTMLDLSNMEYFTSLKELQIEIDGEGSPTVVSFKKNSSFLQKLDILELGIKEHYFNGLFKDMGDQEFNLKKLAFHASYYQNPLSCPYSFYQRFLNNPSLRKSLEVLEIYDCKKYQADSFAIDLKNYSNLKSLSISIHPDAQIAFFNHMLRTSVMKTLEKLVIYGGVKSSYTFAKLICNLKELELTVGKNMMSLYKLLYKNYDNHSKMFVNMEVLNLTYCDPKENYIIDIKVISRLFPNLKCLKLYGDKKIKEETIKYLEEKKIQLGYYLI